MIIELPDYFGFLLTIYFISRLFKIYYNSWIDYIETDYAKEKLKMKYEKKWEKFQEKNK